jgi:hypothetical protein
MKPGSRTWRAAPGLAALTVAALAGCHSVPVARLAPTPNRPQSTIGEVGRAAFLPATVALDNPSEMAAMEPVRAVRDTEPAPRASASPRPIVVRAEMPAPGPAPSAIPPAETPLLDAALEKAKGFEESIVEEMTVPDPAPLAPARPEPLAPALVLPAPEPAKPEVQAEPRPEPPEPPRPEEAWREGIRRLSGLAQAQAAHPDNASLPWGLRARVLAWLAEPDIDPDLDRPESQDVRAVLRGMADAPAGSPPRVDDIRAAIRVLEGRAPLEVADLQLCLKVNGFGDFQAIEPPVRHTGQQVVIYARMDGVRHEATGNGFRSRLAGQVEVIPEGGGAPAWSEALGTGEDTCRYRRNDYFINYIFTIPRTLAPGRYTLRLTEKDLIADRTATREVPLSVVRD